MVELDIRINCLGNLKMISNDSSKSQLMELWLWEGKLLNQWIRNLYQIAKMLWFRKQLNLQKKFRFSLELMKHYNIIRMHLKNFIWLEERKFSKRLWQQINVQQFISPELESKHLVMFILIKICFKGLKWIKLVKH